MRIKKHLWLILVLLGTLVFSTFILLGLQMFLPR